MKPTPLRPPDARARTLAYWLRRHEELKGDIRADGNRGLSVEENRANYERKAAKLVSVLRNLWRETAGKRVLDLGCGTGLYVPALAGELGVSYTGVDLSPVALDQARERFPRGTYVPSDVADLRVEDDFDAVLAVDFLCHLTDDAAWREAIDLMAGLVKRGAVAVVAERLGVERAGAPNGHVINRTVGDYKAAFARHGLPFRPAPRVPDIYIASGLEEADAAREAVRWATTPAEVHAVVKGYPNMSLGRAAIMYDFIREHDIATVLELGFNHGVSTCYLAAALAGRRGGGRVVTIDLATRVAVRPGIADFVDRLGLAGLVTVFYEHTSYNWRLRAFLRMDPRPAFDLIFLDGAHAWEPDALAFLLGERLLRPGGWFVFDDINWSYERSPFFRRQPQTRALPEDERTLPQVREVVELLVKPHPHIAEWREDGVWGYARKSGRRETTADFQALDRLRESAERTRRHALRTFPEPIDAAPAR